MIPRSTDGKQRILSLSYGKDSMACLGAIEQLGWPLDRIVTADVWATDTIPADLPPMVDFKDYADKVILERYGIEVEHFTSSAYGNDKMTYEKGFYRVKNERSYRAGTITGFPFTNNGAWCNSELKMSAIRKARASYSNGIEYIGIAADEPNRFHTLNDTKLSPLVEIGWTESDCRAWCEANDLLSPIYTKSARGGCWFCHNQPIVQLRQLRHDYPDLWALLLKWDTDSPVTFHADGHTVHDFDRRFALEDEGLINKDEPFRWTMLYSELNYRFEGF